MTIFRFEFEGFNFLTNQKKENQHEYHSKKHKDTRIKHRTVIDAMKEFNRKIEDCETSLMRFGHSKDSFYLTGYLVEKGGSK